MITAIGIFLVTNGCWSTGVLMASAPDRPLSMNIMCLSKSMLTGACGFYLLVGL